MANIRKKLGKEKSLVLLLAVFTLILPLFSTAVTAASWNVSTESGFDTGTYKKTIYPISSSRDLTNALRMGYTATDKGLVAYYPLDEDSGSTANDLSGYNNDGSINDAILSSSGKFGTSSYRFDGSNDYITVPHDSSIDIGGSYTISAWVRPTAFNSAHEQIIARQNWNWKATYGLFLNSTGFVYGQFGDGSSGYTVISNSALKTNNWYHLGYVWDGSTQYIYINGSQKGSNTAQSDPWTGTSDAWIGVDYEYTYNQNSGDTHFDGRIEEVKLYNRSLNSSDIQALYERTKGGWQSQVWDSGASTTQKVESLRIDSSIGINESINTRLTAYNESGIQINQSSWFNLTDGTNEYRNNLNISPAYQYQIEYNLSVTDNDTSHTPQINSFNLEMINASEWPPKWTVKSQSEWESIESTTSYTNTRRGKLKLGNFDGFEDRDLTEYSSNNLTSNGDKTDWETQAGTVIEESYSLKHTRDLSNTGDLENIYRESSIGELKNRYLEAIIRDNSNQDGDSTTYGGQGSVLFLDTSTGYGYYAGPNVIDGKFEVVKYNGSYNILAEDTSVNLSYETNYRVEFQRNTDGSMKAILYDDTGTQISSLAATDTDITCDVEGLRANDDMLIGDNFIRRQSKGTWKSLIWDSGASNKQALDSLDINTSIGVNETVKVSLGVDSDDDGVVDRTSSYVTLSNGINTLTGSDFSIDTSGFRYQVQYNLSVTDSDPSHTPTVNNFSMVTSDANNLPSVSNPSPSGGTVLGSTGTDLSVDLSDEDGDSMDAWFFNANNNEQIGSKQTGIDSGGSASVSWTGLQANTTYNWYINVSDGKGNFTSNTFTFKVGLGINLTFRDSSVVEDGFNVYTNSSGSWEKAHSFQSSNVGGTGQRTTNFIDKELDKGERACYRVTAYNEAGESQKSGKACITP